MRISTMLLAAVTLFTVSSCDPAGTEYFIVKNNTDKEIVVTTETETRTVAAHAQYDVTQKSGVGKGDDDNAGEPTNTELKSITQDGKECKKKYATYQDWSRERLDVRTMRYTIFVEQSDF